MAKTEVRSGQIKDEEVKRDDLNVSETGQAVVTKLVAGTGISFSSTGVDAGTGDVTISVTGASVIDNNTFLKWRNAADSADIDVLKLDSSDNTILNAPTGKEIQLHINNAEKWAIDSSGHLIPSVNNTYDIGSSSAALNELWTVNVKSFGDLVLEAQTASGEIYFNTNGSSRWLINPSGILYPVTTDSYALGTTSFRLTTVHAREYRNSVNNYLDIVQDGTFAIRFHLNSTARWGINTATFTPLANNAYDIGTSSFRVKTIYSVNALNTSDERLKENISILDNLTSLSKINSLEPIQYNFIDSYDDGLNKTRLGFKAQQVHSHIPEAVDEGDSDDPNREYGDEGFDIWGIQNDYILATLVSAVQALSDKIDSLNSRVDALEV